MLQAEGDDDGDVDGGVDGIPAGGGGSSLESLRESS